MISSSLQVLLTKMFHSPPCRLLDQQLWSSSSQQDFCTPFMVTFIHNSLQTLSYILTWKCTKGWKHTGQMVHNIDTPYEMCWTIVVHTSKKTSFALAIGISHKVILKEAGWSQRTFQIPQILQEERWRFSLVWKVVQFGTTKKVVLCKAIAICYFLVLK